MGTSGEKTNDLKNDGGWAPPGTSSPGTSSPGSDREVSREGSSAASSRSKSNWSGEIVGEATDLIGLDSTVFDPEIQQPHR